MKLSPAQTKLLSDLHHKHHQLWTNSHDEIWVCDKNQDNEKVINYRTLVKLRDHGYVQKINRNPYFERYDITDKGKAYLKGQNDD